MSVSVGTMSKKTTTAVRPVIGDIRDTNSLYNHMRAFSHGDKKTVSTADDSRDEDCLRYFITWCDERGLQRPHDITRPILERYQRYLFLYRKPLVIPRAPAPSAAALCLCAITSRG